MVIVIIKNSHTIKAGSLSLGFRKVSKMRKCLTLAIAKSFTMFFGVSPNPLIYYLKTG